MRAEPTTGFTLIEVLVALLLSGIVAMGVHDIFGTLSDGASRVSASGEAVDATANADRFLRALVANVESDGDSQSEFGGTSTETAFTSWCQTVHGWLERCRVSLSTESRDHETVLVGRLSIGGTVDLRRLEGGAEFRYLADITAGSQWADRWTHGALTPRAIAIVSARDTVVLRIGDRG